MKEKTSNMIPDSAVDKVNLASELLMLAIRQTQEENARQEIVEAMARGPGSVDRFLVEVLSYRSFGMELMKTAIEKHSGSMDLSEQLERAVKWINTVMARSDVSIPFVTKATQTGVLERMVDQASEELSYLSIEFLAIILARTEDGRRFMQQALEAAKEREANSNQAVIDRLKPKLKDALEALNRVMDDDDVPNPDPDQEHPISQWLIDEITEHTSTYTDRYLSRSLANHSIGRSMMREALVAKEGE